MPGKNKELLKRYSAITARLGVRPFRHVSYSMWFLIPGKIALAGRAFPLHTANVPKPFKIDLGDLGKDVDVRNLFYPL